MWSRLMNFFGFNKKPLPETKKTTEEITQEIPDQFEHAPIAPLIDWRSWLFRAIDISQSFEGEDPWANITGNFDNAGLTCGALGFTWKYNNQPPMVLRFVADHGVAALMELMPETGQEYLQACRLGEKKGMSIVAGWSNGSANVAQPYRRELARFWKSPGMKEIQVDRAWVMMGEFAMNKSNEGQKYFNLAEPKFEHFAYWFDQAVMNGQGETVAFADAPKVDTSDIMTWCLRAPGQGNGDLKKNFDEWADQLEVATVDQQWLFKMAYMRALKSIERFRPAVMNRRGSLALGTGFVNGEKRSFPWRVETLIRG